MEKFNEVFKSGKFVPEPQPPIKVRVPLRSKITGYLVGKRIINISLPKKADPLLPK